MTKKLLKQLIRISYKNNYLDEETVQAIAEKLDRSELKQYIKALKQSEKIRSIFVDISDTPTKADVDQLKIAYPDKKIVMHQDPSLLIGMRITKNDDIIEFNLKHELDAIIEHVIS